MVGSRTTDAIEAFVERWARSSGAERASFQMLAIEMLGVEGGATEAPMAGSRSFLVGQAG